MKDIQDQAKLIKYTMTLFAFLVLMQVLMYEFVPGVKFPGFLELYGWWLFYLDITLASLAGALWYFNSYKGFISCMGCMMVSMTLAMQTGMMLGSVFGAVNGLFIGSMIGMILGTIVGMATGKSYPMGVVQGAMAGVMGGTMGAMIALMMYVDNIFLFMPFYMIINVGILYGFAYIYHEEVIQDNPKVIKRHVGLPLMVSLTLLSGLICTLILLYAPKSALFPI